MKRISLLLVVVFTMNVSGLYAADGGQQNDCYICIESMNGLQAPEITRLSCGAEAGGHAFHTDCLAPWGRRTCPACRAAYSPNDLNAIRANYRAHHNMPSPQDIIDRRESITSLGGLAIMAAFFYGLYHLYHDDPYAEQKPANSEFEEIRRKAWIAYGMVTRIVGFVPASALWPVAYVYHSQADMSAEGQYVIGKLEKKDAKHAQDIMAKKHWNFLRKSSQIAGHCIISAIAFGTFWEMMHKLIKLPSGQRNLPAIFDRP